MGRRIFKIFPLTSALLLFVCFLNPFCISHRQKVSFQRSLRILFLWCNTTCSGSWKPPEAIQTLSLSKFFRSHCVQNGHQIKQNYLIQEYLYLFFCKKRLYGNIFFFNCGILKDRKEKSLEIHGLELC